MLKASENGHDWLGMGSYFWENNYERALDFTQKSTWQKNKKNHIQICIRNPNCIKGFFIPRYEMKWP